jgi:hypothetical protein
MVDGIVGTWNFKQSAFGRVAFDITYNFCADGTYTYVNAVTGQRTDGNYEIIPGNKMKFPQLNRVIDFTLQGDNLSLDYGSGTSSQDLKRV